MPVTPPVSYPGVYIQEIPSGVRTIVGVSTSITAFLGRAPQGLVNEPTMVTNYGDYERNFGGIDKDSTMSYAVRDFFLNGGTQALIVRLFKPQDDDIKLSLASIEVGDSKLVAASPGSWADNLHVIFEKIVDQDVLDRFKKEEGQLFNLYIYNMDPKATIEENKPLPRPTEKIANITIDESPRRLDRVLEQESNILRVESLGASPPGENAVLEATPGKDSASLIASDYQGSEADKTGIYALEKADLFNLLCIPPDTRDGDVAQDIYATVLDYCYARRAMFIVDPPRAWAANKETAAANAKAGLADLGIGGEVARNAALYFPRVRQADPLREGQPDIFPACGILAGVMARTDATRGVWKAPAGIDATLNGINGLQANLTDAENGQLNPLGINCLRVFPTIGTVVWGARTLRGADQLADEYKYVPVRRLALFMEETLYRSTQWAVFEPNDEPLWAQLRLNIGTFMHDLFRQGAFQGQKPGDAYFVQCDSSTTTQSDINKGIVNIIVGFAPLKPAEFVIIYLQQMAGNLGT